MKKTFIQKCIQHAAVYAHNTGGKIDFVVVNPVEANRLVKKCPLLLDEVLAYHTYYQSVIIHANAAVPQRTVMVYMEKEDD